jgi:AcrR family transcriptional regulator
MKEQKDISPYMLSLRERILETAMHDFVAKGIKAVKMDDIAQTLGISKRTLYEIFYNKERLLLACLSKFKEVKEAEFAHLYEQSENVMDIIVALYRQKVEEFRTTSPEFYSDMYKYPSVIEFFSEDSRRSHERFIGFLKRGVDEGYFREDVNMEIVSRIFHALSTYIMENQLYKEFSIEEVFQNLIFVSLRGFSTQKGVEKLDHYLNIKV